jgi:hypothetical protein
MRYKSGEEYRGRFREGKRHGNGVRESEAVYLLY